MDRKQVALSDLASLDFLVEAAIRTLTLTELALMSLEEIRRKYLSEVLKNPVV